MSSDNGTAIRSLTRNCLAAALAVALALPPSLAQAAGADPSQGEARLSATAETDQAALETVAVPSRAQVVADLQRLGLSAEEAQKAVDPLTDEELATLAVRLEEQPAGGNGVGAVVGGVVIIFLVLLLTDILGLTDIFPWVRKPVRR